MSKVYLVLFFTFTMGAIYSCGEKDVTVEEVIEKPQENNYVNPVYNRSMPDPTIIKGRNGYFYMYATEDTRHTPISKSKDLVTWQFVGTAFSEDTRPTFEPNGGLWAPDINFINGQYVLYYSMSVWGGGNT